MTKIAVVLFSLFVSGCIVYPNKHVSVPGFNVTVLDEDASKVFIDTGSPIDEYFCDSSLEMEQVSRTSFSSSPQYSWLDGKMLVPAYCAITVYICVQASGGVQREWKENIGVFCNKTPSEMKFECSTYQGVLSCSSKT
ncbi:hypothetical protein QFX18_19165 [Saccharophagus degradans]|uniref:hypothetical protein n=1 Tax=Saccharophagus degradans TaxID=86304 RepID=UPI0024781D10|nr:hypothetical protein [Saccharophagus degradans]WGO98130.1 hypothetical protein QFX18_19165 [Saccharophagus degradans]